MSFTHTRSESFTRTHAHYLASKVAADLHQMQRFYGSPSSSEIDGYLQELTTLLADGYLDYVEYGFRRDGRWVLYLRYTATSLTLGTDDRSGRVHPGVDTSGASWHSYLTHSSAWWALTDSQRQRVEDVLPFRRTSGDPPGVGAGYWIDDKTYSRNGVALGRRTFRPL